MVYPFPQPEVWKCRVYPFPPPAVWTCRVYPFESPEVWTSRVYPFESPAVWTCWVYPFPSPAVWTCSVYPFASPAVHCGRAGCIRLHRLQCGRAVCIPLHRLQCIVDVQGVSVFTACSVESLLTRSVLLSTPALWACRVHPCPLLAAWTCRVYRLYCLPRCLQGVSLSTFVNCVEMTDCPHLASLVPERNKCRCQNRSGFGIRVR